MGNAARKLNFDSNESENQLIIKKLIGIILFRQKNLSQSFCETSRQVKINFDICPQNRKFERLSII